MINPPKPITVAGVEYPSISAACRAYGVVPDTVATKRVARGKDPLTAVSAPRRSYDRTRGARLDADIAAMMVRMRWRRVAKVLDKWRRERDA